MPNTLRLAALVLATILPTALAGCTARLAGRSATSPAHMRSEAPSKVGTVAIFNDGAVVQWSDQDASVLLRLPGEGIHRGQFTPPQPGKLVLLIGGKAFEILDLDSRLVTSDHVTGAELLSKHRQWETDHWNRRVGVPFGSHTETIADCACPGASLWRLSWPQSVRADHHAETTDQLFLTFVAGRRIVAVTSAVMEGDSVADRVRYLGRVACDARIQAGPIDQQELRQWLEGHGWKRSPAESDRHESL